MGQRCSNLGLGRTRSHVPGVLRASRVLRFKAGSTHQRLPFRAVRPGTTPVRFVDRDVGQFVTEDLWEKLAVRSFKKCRVQADRTFGRGTTGKRSLEARAEVEANSGQAGQTPEGFPLSDKSKLPRGRHILSGLHEVNAPVRGQHPPRQTQDPEETRSPKKVGHTLPFSKKPPS